MLNIDLSFFTWQYFSEYVLPGIYFSVALTVVAAIGGLFFGVVILVYTPHAQKAPGWHCRHLRRHDAQHPSCDGVAVVFPSGAASGV